MEPNWKKLDSELKIIYANYLDLLERDGDPKAWRHSALKNDSKTVFLTLTHQGNEQMDNSLIDQVDHFEWIMKSDVEESFSSESRSISFVPTSSENLTVTATLKGGTDESSVGQPNFELEDLNEDGFDKCELSDLNSLKWYKILF